ncbi:MAG: glycosyltransferase family 2 protein [Desulfosoma sp.]
MEHRTSLTDVSVIVLNWNGSHLTVPCLESLIRSKSLPRRIIVCDNGSTDKSTDHILNWARTRFPEKRISILGEGSPSPGASSAPFVLIKNNANLGFAAGNNSGIRVAVEWGSDFVWLLNNDTLVHSDALGALLRCADQKKSAGVFGSTVVHMDDPFRLQCAGGCRYFPLSTVFKPLYGGRGLHEIAYLPEPRLDYVFGASFFARTDVFRKVGFLNEDFFLFYEEMDFCRRARRAGYDLAWCRPSIVLHKGSASLSGIGPSTPVSAAWVTYFETLSTLHYTRLHHPAFLPWVMTFRLLSKVVVLVAQKKPALLMRALMKAFEDFVSPRPIHRARSK